MGTSSGVPAAWWNYGAKRLNSVMFRSVKIEIDKGSKACTCKINQWRHGKCCVSSNGAGQNQRTAMDVCFMKDGHFNIIVLHYKLHVSGQLWPFMHASKGTCTL